MSFVIVFSLYSQLVVVVPIFVLTITDLLGTVQGEYSYEIARWKGSIRHSKGSLNNFIVKQIDLLTASYCYFWMLGLFMAKNSEIIAQFHFTNLTLA